MSKGPKISPTVKELVRYVALSDKRPRRVVAADLQKQIKLIEAPIPEVETLERLISSARNQALDEQDNPWHLVTTVKYPMPYEALSIVLKVWADAVEHDRQYTIREALWVARLYHVFKDAGLSDDIELLNEVATHYALREKVVRLTEEGTGNKKDNLMHRIDDARLVKLLNGDGRPMAKIVSQIKWRKVTEAEVEELGLPELFKSAMEAKDEGSYSQTVQG